MSLSVNSILDPYPYNNLCRDATYFIISARREDEIVASATFLTSNEAIE